MSDTLVCDCGGKYLEHNLKNHINSTKHKSFLTGEQKKIKCYRSGEFLKIYDTIVDAVQDLRLSYNSIANNIAGRSKECQGGYDFRRVTIKDANYNDQDRLY